MGTVLAKLPTNNIMNKLVLLISFVSACAGVPQGAAYVEENLPPQPYAYQYGVEDLESKSTFQKSESRDAKGTVLGQYVIALPDGRIQTTKYTVNWWTDFLIWQDFRGLLRTGTEL